MVVGWWVHARRNTRERLLHTLDLCAWVAHSTCIVVSNPILRLLPFLSPTLGTVRASQPTLHTVLNTSP